MAEDSLLREVDDDVRRERMHALWRQYRKPGLFVLIVLVVAMTGSTMWTSYQEKKAGEAMQMLDHGITAYEEADYQKAQAEFTALQDHASGELNDLARLWLARTHAANGQDAQARTTLLALADHPQGRDLIWRDMACLRLAGLQGDMPASCTGTGDSPLKNTRLEWQAARLWEAGKNAEARTLLDGIATDEDATQSQRDRVRTLQAAIPAETK